MAGENAQHDADRGGKAALASAIHREPLSRGRVMTEPGPMTAPGHSAIVPLFATPFAVVNTGADAELNRRVVTLCESQRSATSPVKDATHDPLHFRGRNDLLESTDDAAHELRRLILSQASSVVAGLSDLGAASFGDLQVQARG